MRSRAHTLRYPSSDAFGFKALARVAGSFEDKGLGIFTPTATITTSLPQAATQISVSLSAGIGLEEVDAGGRLM
ncbi:MAG: hypothetical protein AUK49_02105 [Betaproteobacteria bacterium CG2_30_68_42]|nr:MAG: hypothetical protein AUK49_02105 [Betaproteobacteria bacterium CG2_30_68_42]PJA57582.1 MAG: hypothetical protein CO164_07180 [Rhodocyclales bacterium CG_4_9_14_3_um_filter_68_10]